MTRVKRMTKTVKAAFSKSVSWISMDLGRGGGREESSREYEKHPVDMGGRVFA